MKHLGVDWGGRRIGLATSDDEGTLAFAYGVRERRGFPNDLSEVLGVVRGVGAQRVVFGLPRALANVSPESEKIDGTRRKREAEMRRFAGALQNAAREAGLSLEIAWQDERFSTREALSGLRAAGLSQKAAREGSGGDSLDARAAAVILQAYLDRQHSTQEGKDG